MKLAQIMNPALGELGGTSDVGFFQGLLTTIVTAILVIGGIVFVIMLLIGGVSYIVSGGDKTAMEGARGRITSALIGIILLFSVFAVVNLIEAVFNIKILTIDIVGLIIS